MVQLGSNKIVNLIWVQGQGHSDIVHIYPTNQDHTYRKFGICR